MFTIEGDNVSFRGIPFATINGRAWPSLRDESVGVLLNGPEGYVSERDHEKNVYDAFGEGEDAGKAAAKRQAKIDADEKLNSERKQISKRGYDDGRADALTAVGFAGDVARVEALLAALVKAHNDLHAVINGVLIDPTVSYSRKRTAKVSEWKRAMWVAMSTLHLAQINYHKK